MSYLTADAVLLDLDGTLYYRERSIPGAVETVRRLRAAGLTLRFLTNTDSTPAEAILDELVRYGFNIRNDELFTPVVAVRRLLQAHPCPRVYPVVSDALRPLFAPFTTGERWSHVVVGDCRDVLDYALLDGAFRALRQGAELVALQRGRFFARGDGDHLDTGAVVAALEYAAGVTAHVLGKPSVDFFKLAAESAAVNIRECVVVGDDPATDIAGGRIAGALTVQVRTGKYQPPEQGTATAPADHVIDSVAALPALVMNATA